MTGTKKVEISHKTIIFTVFFLLFLWFLYFIREIILVFFVALLIMAVLNPMATRLSRFKIPRVFSVLVVYLLAFFLIGVAVSGVVPPLADPSAGFAARLPEYVENLGVAPVISEQIVKELVSQFGALPGQLAKITFSLFSNILGVLTVLFIALYMLLARDKLDDHMGAFFGADQVKKAGRIIDDLERRLGGWARGQLTLMVLVGLMTYVGLRLLNIPFSLPLAILAGILEIVPYIGPIIAAIPLVLIGFGSSLVTGLAAAALALLVQQFENYLFVPKVMEKSVGVSPIITLLALGVGLKVAGIVGVLISVPVVITLQVLLKEFVFIK